MTRRQDLGRVPKFRSRGQVFVTLQEWNEQPAPEKLLIAQGVMAAKGLR
jgi:hypothetical protein